MSLGLILLAVSAYHLVPAILTGEIPTRWPFRPLTPVSRQLHFRIAFIVYLLSGIAGFLLLLESLIDRL